MVNGMELARAGIAQLVISLENEGATVREVNTMLLSAAMWRWIEELGEEGVLHVLHCEINQIEEGAYREDYVPPEARMLDEEEAKRARSRLTVIEGGGGSKV
ncbi:hypothetical protein JZX87_03410 [Agrobacterium sp. Ap1]|uniref:hypothetical protein n=1 Tax=Agrobacterium sp. Ap1 TaxID=2815337 RepID=UPI001A8F3F2B|nr:hypothetical protein [Agrobacterium sp. Ap1]MBO0140214.1 hypothetical protein [Agrobacterium sp. Ap1]